MTVWNSATQPAELRRMIRTGVLSGPTGGLSSAFQQANIVILPQQWASQFQDYAEANPAACPLLSVSEPGDFSLPALGQGIDIRSDLPRYRVLRHGAVDCDPADVTVLWRDDLVTFALGCSLGFEAVVIAAGAELRCHAPGKTCSAFVSDIPTVTVGAFSSPLVVSMRAVRRDQVDLVAAVTAQHPETHGGPVHVGDPRDIGVYLDGPIEGIGLTDIRDDEVAMFWACGVTSQQAIARAALPFAITHFPAHMLVTDLPVGQPSMAPRGGASDILSTRGHYHGE